MKKNILNNIFEYERDANILKKLLRLAKHLPFNKEIIKFLAENNDRDVPKLIIDFTQQKYSEGYRASLLLLLEKYNCQDHLHDIMNLFLKDSYNSTWYCYDILKKYLSKIDVADLNIFYKSITSHITKEKDEDKKQYHLLLLKNINKEIKKRMKVAQYAT